MIQVIDRYVIPSVFSLLPLEMRSPEAHALLLAIGLQESRFEHRRQIGGPARGFWQFEEIGVRGVLSHHASVQHAKWLWQALGYRPTDISVGSVYAAIEHNDMLAAGFARLALWRVPGQLPRIGEQDRAWGAYIEAWGPGKPKPATWASHYTKAVAVVGQPRRTEVQA